MNKINKQTKLKQTQRWRADWRRSMGGRWRDWVKRRGD